jgi:diaminopimelate epimerase
MSLNFYKYQGAGNDFVIFDNRTNVLPRKNIELYKKLCDRRFGIGADGLMLLQEAEGYDFEMVYYNSDGAEGSMCGNGGRCIVAFAKRLGIIGSETKFIAIDGEHEAILLQDELIKLKMIDIDEINEFESSTYFMNTGSPHHVEFHDNLFELDVETMGRSIRNSNRYASEGTNVNFVKIMQDKIAVRTYERGVESETLACGTGVVASTLATVLKSNSEATTIHIDAQGGKLKVHFNRTGLTSFNNIWLEGPANFVFSGTINV